MRCLLRVFHDTVIMEVVLPLILSLSKEAEGLEKYHTMAQGGLCKNLANFAV
jgi:hypothetical protein